MISVNVSFIGSDVKSLTVSGHANYDKYGKDIVCAGVSAVVTGGLNALTNENKKSISCRVNDGYVNVDVLDITNDNLQLIMNVIIIQLRTIEESYKKYVKISEK